MTDFKNTPELSESTEPTFVIGRDGGYRGRGDTPHGGNRGYGHG